MNTQYAKVQYADFSQYKRVIAVSDIHGDKDGFLAMLQKLNFTSEDALVIVGDILERGSQSLELLRVVMELSKKDNYYLVAGNNDVLFEEWKDNDEMDPEVHRYVTHRDNSTVIEMARELAMPYETLEELKHLKVAIYENYQKELDFLKHLPLILESNLATFVHAGIKPGTIEKQDPVYCLEAPAFAKEKNVFRKPIIVGHWPASNYSENIISVNPYVNQETNVYSIDGGNSMKLWHQINYLIFENGEIKMGYYDNLPKVKILEKQESTDQKEAVTLLFPNTLVKIKERHEKSSLCYLPHVDKEMQVDNDLIYRYKEDDYCYDFTTYHLSLETGETVALCSQLKDGILVKKDGIVGLYTGRYAFL